MSLPARPLSAVPILDLYRLTRARSTGLVAGLAPEDMTVQSMPDASPAKWHLAHTSWFFETFVIGPDRPGYRSPDPRFAFLFNSYYVQAGPRYARHQRGLVTRPTVAEVLDYRAGVDAAIEDLMAAGDAPLDLVELGCHHEMQHQELLLTDLLHAFSHNPLRPAYREPQPLPLRDAAPAAWLDRPGGLRKTGHDGAGFAYDCEGPRHATLLQDHQIATRLVTCGEWRAFVEDGGYATPTLWLSDGWAVREREGWEAPLYWWREDGAWVTYSLRGTQPVDDDAPVAHISYYEADAYARWAGARLPTEVEWEVAAADLAPATPQGTFLDAGRLRPDRAAGTGFAQAWGDVWEWTASAFLAYPGFRPAAGAVGEYNGKFMVNQFVLRGGSALTPAHQMRASYRNFFPPEARWQMTGLRLAREPATASAGPRPSAFARAMREGLTRTPKRTEAKWLYDAKGSTLFDAITTLPEYTLTRTETALLRDSADEIGAAVRRLAGDVATLFEPGAGSGEKAAHIAGAIGAAIYVPADINPGHLDARLGSFRARHPQIAVRPAGVDMTASLALPLDVVGKGAVVGFFPGSTIGNFAPEDAASLLARFRHEAGAAALLVGFDRIRDVDAMVAAYNDAAGVTAAFNLNLIDRINHEASGPLARDAFRHVAVWNEDAARIELYLESGVAQTARIGGKTIRFEAGERISTEHSAKFTPGSIAELAAAGGWRVETSWNDPGQTFTLALLAPA